MNGFAVLLQKHSWKRINGEGAFRSQGRQQILRLNIRTERIIALGISFIFVILFTACGGDSLGAEIGYQPPVLPLRVSVNTWGEIEISASSGIITPIGIFDVGIIASPTRYFDGVENTLTIRIDDQECVYDLNGGDFSFDLQGNSYQLVHLRTENKSIFVELQGDTYTGCKQRSAVAAKRSAASSGNNIYCEGASPSYLVVGSRAVVSVNQASVHQSPSELAPLVRNKYLKRDRIVTVIDGPVCGKGNPGQVLFWKVLSEEIAFSNGERGIIVGWIGEESGDVYLLRPL